MAVAWGDIPPIGSGLQNIGRLKDSRKKNEARFVEKMQDVADRLAWLRGMLHHLEADHQIKCAFGPSSVIGIERVVAGYIFKTQFAKELCHFARPGAIIENAQVAR